MSIPLFDYNLPNASTWVFVSFILAVTVFFQFNKPLAARNRDLIALFLFAPGFLLLQRAYRLRYDISADHLQESDAFKVAAYGWLLAASFLWFIRCLLDFIDQRRPAVAPNLTRSGMIWLASSLFVCFIAASLRLPSDPWEPAGKPSPALIAVEQGASAIGKLATGQNDPDAFRFEIGRGLTLFCHLGIATGLTLIGVRHFQNATTGFAMALAYLLMPYAGFQIVQFHLVWPAALLIGAILTYRSPVQTGALLGLAIGTSYFPLLLLPAWCQFYRGRGLNRFLGVLLIGAVVGIGVSIASLWTSGALPGGVWQSANPSDWVPWRIPSSEGIWQRVHWAYRLPVFILYAAFVGSTFYWPTCRNLGQLVAVSAATIIGMQFWFADRGGVYVVWYLPLLIVMAFRPNTVDLQPPNPREPVPAAA